MGVRIVVINRTLNEAANIGRFCEHYSFADRILLTDGGSSDGTVEIAGEFKNVSVKDVSRLQIEKPDSPYGFITPEPMQTNILIDWAKAEGADWIIRDESDCWPNSVLRQSARYLLETSKQPSIFLYRLYLWGSDSYFPKMNEPGRSLWAWRPAEVDIYADPDNPYNASLYGLSPEPLRRNLDAPFVCLHYFCPDEETVERKMAIKQALGERWDHPLRSIYAPARPLPGWAL